METLAGVFATFDHAMILHQDPHYFGWVLTELLNLTVKHKKLHRLEFFIGGYNDDKRSLYEVPEVRRWIRLLQEGWPDSMMWLTPGSLWVWILSLNPKMCTRLPDGQMQIVLDPEIVIPQFAESLVAGEDALKRRGMSKGELKKILKDAQSTLDGLFQRKKAGTDYLVIHPETGEPRFYERPERDDKDDRR
jgi:hypothetical protein